MTVSKEVFAVKPERVCTGTYHRGSRSCALGWADNFRIDRNKFETSYLKVYKTAANRKTLNRYAGVVVINDTELKCGKDRAAVINATLREMGYRIPKSSTVGKNILQKGWTVKKG
jgi:hypothetical protein